MSFSLKSKIISSKDATVSSAIQNIINFRLKSKNIYIKKFSIDTQNKTIQGIIIFEKEEPLEIKVYDYHITTKNNKYFLEVSRVEKSRDWDNSYIDGKRYKIPSELLRVIDFIL